MLVIIVMMVIIVYWIVIPYTCLFLKNSAMNRQKILETKICLYIRMVMKFQQFCFLFYGIHMKRHLRR